MCLSEDETGKNEEKIRLHANTRVFDVDSIAKQILKWNVVCLIWFFDSIISNVTRICWSLYQHNHWQGGNNSEVILIYKTFFRWILPHFGKIKMSYWKLLLFIDKILPIKELSKNAFMAFCICHNLWLIRIC